MNIILTGSNGFLGKNLQIHLRSIEDLNLIKISKDFDFAHADETLKVDLILHFGGVNRSEDKINFVKGNIEFTRNLLKYASKLASPPAVIFASSTQSKNSTNYGETKHAAEKIVLDYGKNFNVKVDIMKLPNIYGKWAKALHNSVVATFAMQVSKDLPVSLFDESKAISFLYIDDLCEAVVSSIKIQKLQIEFEHLIQELTPLEIFNKFAYFKSCLKVGLLPRIDGKLEANLYATYLSQLDKTAWVNHVIPKVDSRGSFVEVFKIQNSFQVSVLKIPSGQTRGEHLHNSKIERFFIVSGELEFTMRQPFDNGLVLFKCSEDSNNLIEAIPGLWHGIKNIGEKEAVVLVWASEIFDPAHPDTFRWEWK